ncbi:MAG TPA: hypothetical protein DC047_19690 [Blastocatellia bacterium]|nr:hypothetical protein [Blastocatellia bacterium]
MKNDHPEQLPLARTEQLIVKEVDDEVLVYDLKTDQAHCLNKTAALVWKNCDGSKSVGDISLSLAESGAQLDQDMIWMALAELKRFELVSHVPTRSNVVGGMGRRQMMRNVGIAAAALPMIVSIIAPTPAQAASNIGFHQPCCGGDTCAPGTSCVSHPTTPPCNMWCN